MAEVRPAIIILFGITGDLAQRKLMPALYYLYQNKQLHDDTVILGITRRDITTEDMVKQVASSIEAAENSSDPAILAKLQGSLRMHTMSQVDPAEYEVLKKMLDDIESEKGVCMDRLFYLSIPPQMFGPIVRNLGAEGLNKGCGHGNAHSRLLIEKPFGYDLKTAEELIHETLQCFDEEQTFHIDHYLAKDAVQNIPAFRAAAPDLEKLWNSRHISRIEITAFEQIDIEGRAAFYEEVGALRDFIQGHLLQVLALTIMDLPADDSAEAAHDSRLAALREIVPLTTETARTEAVRGQYTGYQEEVSNQGTVTETFARITLQFKGDRWEGTTATLQTGKALDRKLAEATVYFTADSGAEQCITFHIQPSADIALQASGTEYEPLIKEVEAFNQAHGTSQTNPLGYERVFLDAIRGDHTIFPSSDEILTAWGIVEAVLYAWSQNGEGLRLYEKGSAGVL